MEIKKLDGTILYTCDCDNIEDALTNAVKFGANLGGADLRGADLRGANLCNAYLGGANLRGADLGNAYLGGADLRGADLGGAYLGGANIRDANLRGANLRGAYLRDADLRDANLGGADLRGANLYGADLGGAYLGGANLRGANLRGANLRDADLRGADLGNAYLGGADLYDADLRDAKNIPYIPLACPSDGEFTAWKKADGKLVKLLIPADARRLSATTNKCRCDKAMVVAITSLDQKEEYKEATSYTYNPLTYRVGDTVYPDSFDENRWEECSNGIHFFVNKQDAINY